ncbi:MAG: hypothetical protein K9I85_06010 [Saprospiraceae bacterium]|nr:hypothetical protein [Saprospiraceae bacterium]
MKDITKWLLNMLLSKVNLKKWVFWLVASIIGGILWAIGNYNEACGGCLAWSGTVMSIGSFLMGLIIQRAPENDSLPPVK